jgi:hypothetical protein
MKQVIPPLERVPYSFYQWCTIFVVKVLVQGQALEEFLLEHQRLSQCPLTLLIPWDTACKVCIAVAAAIALAEQTGIDFQYCHPEESHGQNKHSIWPYLVEAVERSSV